MKLNYFLIFANRNICKLMQCMNELNRLEILKMTKSQMNDVITCNFWFFLCANEAAHCCLYRSRKSIAQFGKNANVEQYDISNMCFICFFLELRTLHVYWDTLHNIWYTTLNFEAHLSIEYNSMELIWFLTKLWNVS